MRLIPPGVNPPTPPPPLAPAAPSNFGQRLRIVLFCHSLVSCWNHGNVHFLRGVVRELQARGHEVRVLEPADGWSRGSLLREQGVQALEDNLRATPAACVTTWRPETLDLDAALEGADLVLVHEWSPPELIARLGRHRLAGGRYLLLFHDTHHRAVTRPAEMARYRLDGFDGVLAFGAALREVWLARGWAQRAWVWHEAADLRAFGPRPEIPRTHDLVWIGNWGDDERADELMEFLLRPVGVLGLGAAVHGVRWPPPALRALRRRRIAFRGWLPNHRVPEAFAGARVTVHVPRRPYAAALPGIPTIRVFEALACGIPLVSAPWHDAEGLFTPGEDFLMVRDGAGMKAALRRLLHEPALAAGLAARGQATVAARHSCADRVDELLAICAGLAPERFAAVPVDEPDEERAVA
jgi:spore maturation protein CgeB